MSRWSDERETETKLCREFYFTEQYERMAVGREGKGNLKTRHKGLRAETNGSPEGTCPPRRPSTAAAWSSVIQNDCCGGGCGGLGNVEKKTRENK